MKKTSQKGIAHLSLLLLLVVIAVVAFAGYKVAKNHDQIKPSVSTTAPAASSPTQTIESQGDLNNAESTLDNTNLDSNLNPNDYDQDINSLL
jgi:hypothetical protein